MTRVIFDFGTDFPVAEQFDKNVQSGRFLGAFQFQDRENNFLAALPEGWELANRFEISEDRGHAYLIRDEHGTWKGSVDEGYIFRK